MPLINSLPLKTESLTDISAANVTLGEATITVLLHCGPWAESQFRSMVAGLSPEATAVVASLYPSSDEVGLRKQLRLKIKLEKTWDKSSLTSSYGESIARCRFLRSLPESKARTYVGAIDRVWAEVLESVRPVLVLSELIDSFVIERLERSCRSRGIPFMGLVTSFVDGYFRVSRYGEHVAWREPSSQEVMEVTEMLLAKGYVPGFARASGSSRLLAVIKRWARNWLRAGYLGALSLYPPHRINNMISGGFVTARQRLHLRPRVRLGSPNWRKEARAQGLPVIVVPLQLTPESTVDYWTHDVERINYHQMLIDTLNKLEGRFTFLVKEHPNVLGDRHPGLYRDLERRPDVVFAETWTPSSDLLEECDGILVWTGSMGFEAALRGKAVLALTPVYYMSGQRLLVLEESISSSAVEEFVLETSKLPISESEQHALVKHLLAGLVKGSIAFRSDFKAVKDRYTDPYVIGQRLRDVVGSHAHYNR